LQPLSAPKLRRLREALARTNRFLAAGRLDDSTVAQCRRMYEQNAAALSDYFLMSLPDWTSSRTARRNWRVPLSDRREAQFAVSDPFTQRGEKKQRR
jgi:hypothetical protein